MTDSSDRYDYLKSKLRIDKNALDDELVSQPAYFQEIAHEETMAFSVRDESKDLLKRTHADLMIRIRKRLIDEKSKATDSAVIAEVESHADYHEAQDLYREACRNAGRWTALKDAWISRGYMLRDLVVLFVNEYYQSAAVVTPATSDGIDTTTKAVRQKAASARAAGRTRKSLGT